MSDRYAVLQATPEGSRIVGTTDSLQRAVEEASEHASYEIYDYGEHEFVHPPEAFR